MFRRNVLLAKDIAKGYLVVSASGADCGGCLGAAESRGLYV